MSTNFLILKNILAELKRKNSITVLEEYYQGKWEFYDSLMDLANDEKAYKDLIELANQAKKAVSQYFRRKEIQLQAFYVRTEYTSRVLNINLINYNRSEPIRISDILQQERDISALNIYCDKKHNMYAYRKGKERHYEFKEDAYYEMTSTWPVQDKHGETFTCTMVMNVSSSGITEVLQFNGKDFESPSKEFWELIRQNKELYIQGLSLHDAVKALLEKNKNAPAVSNLQNNEHSQDEKLKGFGNDIKNSSILPLIGNNLSTQIEINPQQIATQVIHPIATQTEVNLQHTETQTEVAVQHVETQTEIGSQETETQTEVAVQHVEIQTEISSQETETQTEVAVQHVETQTGISSQETETQTEVNLQEVAIQAAVNLREAAVQTEVNSQQLDQNLTKAEQEIRKLNERESNLQHKLEKAKQKNVELEKHNSDLQNELGKEKQETRELNEQRNKLQHRLDEAEQKIEELEKHNSHLQNELEGEKQENVELQIGLTQKDEKLTNISVDLQEKVQKLESVHEKEKELISELRKLHKELNHLKEEKYSFEDKLDQLKLHSNNTKKSSEQQISDLEGELLSLKDENKMLSNYAAKQIKSEQEPIEAKQKIEELEKYNSDLQDKLGEEKQKNAELQVGLTQKDEKLANMSTELQGKAQELENVCEEKEDLKKKLKIANAEQEKLKGKLNQFEKEEETEELECIMSEKDERLMDLKSQMQNLENEHNTHLEFDEQEADQLIWDFEELKNKLETKDEQIETIRGQLRQEIEKEIVNKYRPLLESKFKEYENKIEELMQIVADKVQEVERLTGEREELTGKAQYLNSQVEMLSPVSDQLFVNKKEVCDNNSKMFYQLTIDDSEKKSRSSSFDSVFHSDGDDDHCNSLLDFISSPSKVCSQSQRESV